MGKVSPRCEIAEKILKYSRVQKKTKRNLSTLSRTSVTQNELKLSMVRVIFRNFSSHPHVIRLLFYNLKRTKFNSSTYS